MASVKLSKLAEDDLVDIYKFIADDNPVAAAETVEAIYSRIQLIATQPQMGRDRPNLRSSLQSHPFGNYIIFFFATKRPKGVEIVRILDAHRDIDPESFE